MNLGKQWASGRPKASLDDVFVAEDLTGAWKFDGSSDLEPLDGAVAVCLLGDDFADPAGGVEGDAVGAGGHIEALEVLVGVDELREFPGQLAAFHAGQSALCGLGQFDAQQTGGFDSIAEAVFEFKVQDDGTAILLGARRGVNVRERVDAQCSGAEWIGFCVGEQFRGGLSGGWRGGAGLAGERAGWKGQ